LHSSKIHKVAITGPESTGKSTLSEALAKHYGTCWVPEFARIYLNRLGRQYQKEDLVEIAKGQIEREERLLLRSNKLLFCDTDLLVIKIWSEFKYHEVDPYILNQYNTRNYDLYLLMDIDLPWEYDPQREHPEMRAYFFEWFKSELDTLALPYKIVSGSQQERLTNAVKVVDEHFRL
jgi:NadR type nicotinamide-nucleotide adenylyltransferase